MNTSLHNLTLDELKQLKVAVEKRIVELSQKPNMAHDIRLKTTELGVYAYTPFSSDFVKAARNLKGKWDYQKSAWLFSKSHYSNVKELLQRLFSVSGEEPYETVIIRIPDLTMTSDYCDDISLFGYCLCYAKGRDSGAALGDNVYLISGEIHSGGSSKNWKTICNNATFEIHNFPVAALDREDVKEALAEHRITIRPNE